LAHLGHLGYWMSEIVCECFGTLYRVVRDLARVSMRGKPVLAFTNDLRGQATPTPVTLQQVIIYLSIYYTVYTHIKAFFTVVKNGKCCS